MLAKVSALGDDPRPAPREAGFHLARLRQPVRRRSWIDERAWFVHGTLAPGLAAK